MKQPETAERGGIARYLPHGCVMLAGCLWGMIGLFSRHLAAAGFGPQNIVLLRNFGGFLALFLLFLCLDRSVFFVKLRHLPYFAGTGIVSVLLFTLCYFSCQQLSSLAVSAILLYTAPTFVVLFSALLFRDRITKQKLAALGLAFLGCLFVSGIVGGSLLISWRALLFGLGSGLFYGLYSIFGRYALRHYRPFTVTFYTFVFAGFGSLFLASPGQTAGALFSQPSLTLLALGLILLCTVLPYLLYTKGLSRLDAGRAAILASTEPVMAAFVGIAAFAEPMGLPVLLGLLCVLASIYILR